LPSLAASGRAASASQTARATGSRPVFLPEDCHKCRYCALRLVGRLHKKTLQADMKVSET
jgi:hypothetical protein